MAVTIRLWAFYELSADSTGATGLTVTVDVDKVSKSAGTVTRVTTGGAAAEMANGVYSYAVANVSDLDTYDYVGVFKTAATTVKSKHVPSLQQDLIAAASQIMALLDVAVSSRNATAPPTASAIADEVRVELATELARVDVAVSSMTAPSESDIAVAILDALLAGHVIPGSVAAALAAAGAAGDPMTNQASGYETGSLGKLIMQLATVPIIVHRDTTDQYGNVYVTQSCDYYAVDGRALTWTKATWPVLTDATVVMRVNTVAGVVDLTCTVTAAQTVQLELSASQVDSLGLGVMAFDLLATLDNGHDVDLYLQQMLTVTSKLAAP